MGGMKDFAKLVLQQTETAKAINEVKTGIADIKKAKEDATKPAPPPPPVVPAPVIPVLPTTPLVPPPPGALPMGKPRPTLRISPTFTKTPAEDLTPAQQTAVAGVSDRPRLRINPPEPRPAPTPIERPTIRISRVVPPEPPAPRVLTPQQQQAIEGVKKMKEERLASTAPSASKPAKTRAQRRAMGAEAIARIRESLNNQKP